MMNARILLGSTMAMALLGGSVLAKTNTKPIITSDRAQEIAVKRIPGTVEQSNLIKRHGKQMYSVFVKEDNGMTVHEMIGAKSGKIKSISDETPETAKIK